ncbi:MAG: hypothetical protein NT031_17590 [Planctomycetota bacterium]|nr:hypothetical protein [Planctomycetota bacterium]
MSGNMVQVLHVIDPTTPVFMRRQMERLAGPDEKIAQVGPSADGGPARGCHYVLRPPLNSDWLAGVELSRLAGRARVVHAWGMRACQAARVTGCLHGRRVLLSLPCVPGAEQVGWLIARARRGLLDVTVPTVSARERLVARGMPERSVYVLPPTATACGDAAARRLRARGQLGLQNGQFLIVAPTEMTRAGGHRMASWAHAILRRIESGVFLLMPGGGQDEKGIRSFVVTTGFAGEVFFPGDRMATADALAAGDMAVFFHERDCGVGALAWAMAAGLPHLAECAPAGVGALLAKPHDPRQASAAILRIMQDGALRGRLGQEAARRAGEKFAPAVVRARLNEIYAAIESGGRELSPPWWSWLGRTSAPKPSGSAGGESAARDASPEPERRERTAPAPISEDIAKEVIFADESARKLLGDRLGEMCRPGAPEWEKIKANPSRTVYRGRVKGQWVYLKHFHRRDWVARLARLAGFSRARGEMRLSQYLAAANVSVPEPLAARCGTAVEWVATREVAQAEPADEWQARQDAHGPEGRKALRGAVIALAELIGRMHAAGVLHGDLHCGNVLVRTRTAGPKLVLMDLHRAWRRRWLTRTAMAGNLAQLYHDRRDMTTRTDRMRFLKHYLKASGARGTLRGWSIMVEAIGRRHTRRQHAKRDDRVMGTGKYFTKLSLPNGWCGHAVLASKWKVPGSKAARLTLTAQGWRDAVGNVDSLFDGPDVTVVKDTPSVLVIRRRIHVDGHWLDVYLKRPRRKQAYKTVLDCVRAARSIRAFQLGHALLTRRIMTAMPLAAFERRIGPVLLDSVLITEAVEAPDLRTFLSAHLNPPGGWMVPRSPAAQGPMMPSRQYEMAREVLRQLGRLLQRLHEHHFTHRDLKSSNLLARWLGEEGMDVVLLDLDGLKSRRVVTAKRRFKDLMRLNVALLECPAVNRAGRLRMLTGYLRGSVARGIPFKPYWRTLEEMSDQKRRRQIRSRREKQKAVRRPGS